jgi:hypothetical protein
MDRARQSKCDAPMFFFSGVAIESDHSTLLQYYIKDTKSSSGTFLNHIRLSPPNSESRPFQLKDGDVVQLGVDYQGGTEGLWF